VQITHTLNGNVTTATVTIHVVASPALESPVCVVGSYREVDIPALPAGVSLHLDERIQISGTTTNPGGSQLHLLRLNSLDDRTGVFRLGGTSGPVLSALPFRTMRMRTSSETVVLAKTNLGDNTWDVVMPVIVDGLYDGVTISYDIFIGGVTFDDGLLSKTLAVPGDFSQQGECLLHFLKTGLSGSNCYNASIWQGLTRIF